MNEHVIRGELYVIKECVYATCTEPAIAALVLFTFADAPPVEMASHAPGYCATHAHEVFDLLRAWSAGEVLRIAKAPGGSAC